MKFLTGSLNVPLEWTYVVNGALTWSSQTARMLLRCCEYLVSQYGGKEYDVYWFQRSDPISKQVIMVAGKTNRLSAIKKPVSYSLLNFPSHGPARASVTSCTTMRPRYVRCQLQSKRLDSVMRFPARSRARPRSSYQPIQTPTP